MRPSTKALLRRSYSTGASLHPVPRLPRRYDVQSFREQYFKPQQPALFPGGQFQDSIPASSKWFSSSRISSTYLLPHRETIIPLELTEQTDSGLIKFNRITAPLDVFLQFHSRDQSRTAALEPQMYLAQCSIADLPEPLQNDLPTPEVVLQAGRGDVYDSSIWLGMPPTYTPLHRDPNPNLFVQLSGEKRIRLFPPDVGRMIYQGVVRAIAGRSGSEKMRGEEMMSGEERALLEKAVWGSDAEEALVDVKELRKHGLDAELGPGDGLFVPKGWWHSVKGVGNAMNGSVNWWFR